MTTQIGGMIKKSVSSPDIAREFPNGKVSFVRLFDRTLAHLSLRPGWKWSTDIKPLVNTESCECSHLQYVISGTLRVRMDDGTEFDLRPGDCVEIAPGHDAWVVGREEFRAIDFNGDVLLRHMEETSRGRPSHESPREEWTPEGY